MRHGWSAVRLGLFTFLVAAAVLLGIAGSYLAMHPGVGGWRGVKPTAPTSVRGTTSSSIELVRTSEGVFWGRRVDAIGATETKGTLLGKVDFIVSRSDVGWPRVTRSEWHLGLNTVQPSPGAPAASDETAWRALVAEAYSHGLMAAHDRIPGSLLRGDAYGTELYPWAFVQNSAERLWHAPLWGAACLGLAVILGVGVGFADWRKKRPGFCGKCGYDLAGLAGGVCPECGAADGSRGP